MKRALDPDIAKWKESKEIEGVSASSIIDFKAIVANERNSQGASKVRRIALDTSEVDVTKLKNKGVSERGLKDETEAEREAALNSYAHAEQKLREKSKIYDQFVQGRSLEQGAIESEYLIDFERKQWDGESDSRSDRPSTLFHDDIQREEQRRRWEEEAKRQKEEEDKAFEKRQEDKTLLGEVILETIKGRERAQKLQEERKKKLEMRKLEVQKKVELQREKKEKEFSEQKELERIEKEEREKKKLHLKGNS